MTRLCAFLSLACILSSTQFVQAQANPAAEPKPTMTVILTSEKKILDDFRMVLVDLAGAKKEYETLSDAIKVLVEGIDETKPMSWRNYLKGKESRALNTATMVNAQGMSLFLASLRDLGYTTKRDLTTAGLYRMGGQDTGSIYYNSKSNLMQMAPIGTKQDAAALKASHAFSMLIKSAPPSALLKGKDAVFYLENDKAQMADRVSAWSGMVTSILKAIEKKKEKENDTQYNLRVTAAKQQLAELERFFVEAATARIDWQVTKSPRQGRAELDLTALPETALQTSIEELGKSPDDFTGISTKDAVVHTNINFALETQRRKHTHELAKTWMPALSELIEKNKDLDASQKETHKILAEIGTEMVHGVADFGVVNGFARLYTHASGYTTLGAIKLADSAKILPLIKKLEGHQGVTMKLDADKEGELSIHIITLDYIAKKTPRFFDKSGTIYLATGPKVIWYASGEGGLELLKKTYLAAKETGPKTGGPLVEGQIALAPWADFIDLQRGKAGDPVFRKIVVDALKKGQDTMTLKLEKVGDHISGFMLFDEGILRAAGKIIAKAVKENIGDE